MAWRNDVPDDEQGAEQDAGGNGGRGEGSAPTAAPPRPNPAGGGPQLESPANGTTMARSVFCPA